jgi:hypothetical protein
MNCFEARQDFAPFWRDALDDARRAELSAHLKDCAKCERAFRTFALTAPVLHSEAEPASRRTAVRVGAPAHRLGVAVRAGTQPRRWMAMCAMVTLFVSAGLAAYLSVTAPLETLTDALSSDAQEPAVQLFGADLTLSSNDLAS